VNGTTTGGWARWTTMIEPAGGGCEIQVSLEYELPGEIVGSILSLLTGHRIEREFRKTYDNLRRVAEMLAAPAGAGVAAGVPAGVAAGAVGAAMGGSAALSLLADEVEVREPGRLATT
jgi:hypothetical protein